ncbi:hypothetical protein [Pseudoxanthomonas mexicana]|uniref:hypothetical protein n=1 Tax=Pseudoxanthomonas mexicana TaxID=128785 RepID=UPI00209FDC93|nr:hypothetical protein [Pseudoxanthomonas mexicana]MCP1582010.1 hypothetical protein [Pseudoxanthomonas mexicana]
MITSALPAWISHPVVLATVSFSAVIAVVGYLATADRPPVTRRCASAGLFAVAMVAGLQYI